MGNVQMEADQIRYKDSTGTYRNVQTGLAAAIAGGGGGSGTLAGLTDTDITTPTNGQVLAYDSTESKWVNAASASGATTLEGLTDTAISTPADGQVLTYDGTAEKWENAAIPAQSIDGLSDTAITTPSDGQVLTYDGTDSKWVNTSGVSEEGIESLIDTTVGWTGKNQFDYDRATSEGSEKTFPCVINGLTFTKNADSSITVTGEASATTQLFLWVNNTIPAGNYTISGCPSGGGTNKYDLRDASAHIETGDGYDVNIASDVHAGDAYYLIITIYSGYNITDSLVFSPMIRSASVTDSTYEPYHKSVEEILEEIKVKYATFSGTTSGSGNLLVSTTEYRKIIAVDCLTRTSGGRPVIALPYFGNASQNEATWLHFCDNDSTMPAAGNLEVEGTYYYID